MNKLAQLSLRSKIGGSFALFGFIGLIFFSIFSYKVIQSFITEVKDREVVVATHALIPVLSAAIELDMGDQIDQTITYLRKANDDIAFVKVQASEKTYQSGVKKEGLREQRFAVKRDDGKIIGLVYVGYTLDAGDILYLRYILFSVIYLVILIGVGMGIFSLVGHVLQPLERYALKLSEWKIGESITFDEQILSPELRSIDQAFQKSSEIIASQYQRALSYQEELEQAVRERTHELALLNEALAKTVTRETLLRQEDEKFNNIIFDTTSLALSLRDEKFAIVRINDAYRALFGYSALRLGQTRSITPVHQKIDDVIAQGLKESAEGVWSGDGRVLTALNRYVDVYIVVNKIFYQERLHYVVAITDLTAVKAIEAEKERQEKLLLQQSKLAAMGEMIGNIAHQWRQPLTQMSTLFMGLELANDLGTLTEKKLKEKVSMGEKLVTYMSQTIDDFRNFFMPDKAKKFFKPSKMIENILSLMGSTFEHHHIRYSLNVVCEKEIEGFDSEYAQVIMNILSNAKDVLTERSIVDPSIEIRVGCSDQKVKVTIEDNGGGIDDAIVDKIFEPYFTTKHKSMGTGLGLYMSKMIIEKNMGGKIYVYNTSQGACFEILV